MAPPLASDAISWARGVSAWTRSAGTPATVGRDAAAAIQAARSGNGQIATLLAPADTCWDEGGVPGEKLAALPPPTVPAHRIREIANVFRSGEGIFLLLGGPLLDEQLLANAKAIASATGAKVMAEAFKAGANPGVAVRRSRECRIQSIRPSRFSPERVTLCWPERPFPPRPLPI